MAEIESAGAPTAGVDEAEVVSTYGPFAGVSKVNGVTSDGRAVWFATGQALMAFDPAGGEVVRSLDVPCDAGTAYDGRHLYQLDGGRIRKIDPATGAVLSTIEAPVGGGSGLTWAEGALWMGCFRDRRIHQIDPATGAVLRTIASDRFVTGVTWTDGELWHATWEDDGSELRQVDPETGHVLTRLRMPDGAYVSGLEAAGDRLYAGCAKTARIRAVRRPRRRG